MNRRANLLLVSCHDLGRHIGCYGVRTVRTPNIDRLAEEGARFTNAFCVAPQCSPSRAAIYTGRYPHNNGVMGLVHRGFAWDLHHDEIHLARRLHDAGWYSALIGVQHETNRPHEMGYDEIVPRPRLAGANRPEAAALAEQAAEFFQQRAKAQRPFFLQLGFFEPHRVPTRPEQFPVSAHQPSKDVTVPPYLVDDESARREFGWFEASIRDVDDAMGRILRALHEHGLADDTLVLFTADHGVPFPRAKCSVYDPGLEVPLILRWPRGPWQAGAVHDQMMSNIDYLPTLCDLLGLEVPAKVQGRSFAPLLRGQAYEPHRDLFFEMTYHDYYDPVRAIRTETHKLMVYFMFNYAFMDPSQQWRPACLTVQPEAPKQARHDLVEFYDLRHDPLEHHNLADDPAQAELRRELLARLHQWMRRTDDPLLRGVPMAPMHRRAVEVLSSANT